MRIVMLLLSSFVAACAGVHHAEGKHPIMSVESCGDGTVNVLMVPTGSVDFSVSGSRPTVSDIYINSNFFDSSGPIGELIIGGHRLSSRVRGGGYFFVKGGRPQVSAYIPPKDPEYSTQSILVAINDGKPNSHVLRQSHARELTYRSLIGSDASGDIYIIASTRLGLVTAADIVGTAQRLGVREAILPDAGSSVDYKLSDGSSEESFRSIPNVMKRAMKIEEPKSYIVGTIRR